MLLTRWSQRNLLNLTNDRSLIPVLRPWALNRPYLLRWGESGFAVSLAGTHVPERSVFQTIVYMAADLVCACMTFPQNQPFEKFRFQKECKNSNMIKLDLAKIMPANVIAWGYLGLLRSKKLSKAAAGINRDHQQFITINFNSPYTPWLELAPTFSFPVRIQHSSQPHVESIRLDVKRH